MRDEKNCLKRALQVKPVVRQSADGVELPATADPIIELRVPKTSPGVFAAHLAKNDEVRIENAKLRADLAQWRDALVTRRIDARLIRPSKWACRLEDSYNEQSFFDLKMEIESAGGNVQPIKVRPIESPNSDSQTPGYEIVFGHRRHRACFDLGLPVLAVIESMDDQTLFVEMIRENCHREDLSSFETGSRYAKALNEKLFPTGRNLANRLGMNYDEVARYLSLAKPFDVAH